MKKVSLVTGSSRGIGKACIIDFASKGYNVVINYLNSEKEALELQKYVIDNYDVDAITIKADVSDEEEVKKMIGKIIDHFGKIDVVVNNASIAIDTTFDDKSTNNFKKILDINLIGSFLICKYASKVMNKGSIINIVSTNGIDTYYPYSLDYDASKAAVISLTHNLSILLSPNIRVNAVAPGWVNTDMNKDLDASFIKEENKKIYLNRFAKADEIAKVVTFLASDDASYINNEIIRVDGGSNHA